ncbi:acyltransferase [soil metagenome]
MTRRIEGIDLLRGVAVGLVMLRHALPEVFGGAGVVGIVMFFALSGYLITGLLSTELERTGRLDLRRFYARRARRLVPALVVLVVGVVGVTVALDPLGDRGELGRTVLFALTWTGNLPFGHASDATFHLWTLATEEQFYLLWPALLALAFARGRVGTAVLAAAVGCLLACGATLVWLRSDPDLAYALPTSWAVCFVIGAGVRVYGERWRAPRWSIGMASGALTLLAVIPLRGHALTYLAGGPAIAALTGVLLLAGREQVDVTAATLRPLVWLGTVSYAAYLWNYPLTLWWRAALDDEPGGELTAGLVAAVLTLGLAAASTRWVEEPFLRRRSPQPVALRARS